MRFDDRLRTVLAQPASDPHDRAIRWRQLVELVARSDETAEAALVQEAVAAIRQDASELPERIRIAAALAVAPLPLGADLVAAFAADRLSVAAPVLASARLTAAEWKEVAASASQQCRAFIGTMRSDQQPESEPLRPPPPQSSEDQHVPSISDVVARIERLRQAREAEATANRPALPDDASPRLFRWECNEAGEIDWVDGAPRGVLVGQSIAQRGADGAVDRTVERAFARRAPFHEAVLELPRDNRLGGTWKISGVPAFERASGRFAGYRGVAERSSGTPPAAVDPNAVRELAHEIRTPLNAIIGFAEIISGEYLGPAEWRYRERANEIVAQARLLLAAVEDLDFAARMQGADGDSEVVADIGRLAESLAPRLRELAAGRNAELDASRTTADLTAAIEPEVAERLILRMCSAVIARASEGERLRLSVDQGESHCSVSITRPLALLDRSDADLFGAPDDALSEGFALRLVRGLAQSAGADVIACPRTVRLLLARR